MAENKSPIIRESKKEKKEDDEKKYIPEHEKKMTGPLFWIVLGLVLIDDIIDLILTLTGFGSVVASAISIFISGLSIGYTVLAGASLDTRFTFRMLVTQVAEIIPLVNLLPFGGIFLILTRLYENDPKIRALVDTAAKATPKGNITRVKKG